MNLNEWRSFGCRTDERERWEEPWDRLRAAVAAGTSFDSVKEEGHFIEVNIDDVHYLQPTCGRRLRDRRSLQETMVDLEIGVVDPMRHPDFILNVAMANVRVPMRPWQQRVPMRTLY